MPEPVTPPAIGEKLAEQLAEHKGQWVAVYQGEVVAVGDSAVAVRDDALAKHITDPTIFRVPSHPERLAYY